MATYVLLASFLKNFYYQIMRGFLLNLFWHQFCIRLLFVAVSFLPVFAAQGISLDWSGYSRMDAYYQNRQARAYGGYQLVLEPTLSVLDGLNIVGRLELYPPNKEKLFYPSYAHRSFGLPLFYGEKGEFRKTLSFSPLFFDISHLYINYETEFFQLQGGRSPRQFGLGVTYNEGSPFNYWLSTLNQLFFYTEYGPFYVQPALLMETDTFLGLLQGGILQDSWQAEAFYRYNTKTSENYIEVFGEYKKKQWKAGLSVSYKKAENTAFGVAFEGEAELPWSFQPEIQFKAGMASKGFSFHPGYDVAFLFQNYGGFQDNKGSLQTVSSDKSSKEDISSQLFIQEGFLQELAYFSSQLEVSPVESFKISPLVLLAWLGNENSMSYEIDLKGQYTFEERFIVLLKGGVLYRNKWDFGLLSQAVVTF